MTDVYHITHVGNLARIAAAGALWSDRRVRDAGLPVQGIAYGHIKRRREAIMVTLAPHGTLADYVPFYFCPRSPMLYALHRNQVPDYSGGQSGVVHLVVDAEAVIAAGYACVHTDGNAASEPRSFHDSRGGFAALSWDVIRSNAWFDTADDNDRKRRKQAEFLVHGELPWRFITGIGVLDATTLTAVQNVLEGTGVCPPVAIRRDWYYA